jgi:hypothetical protein
MNIESFPYVFFGMPGSETRLNSLEFARTITAARPIATPRRPSIAAISSHFGRCQLAGAFPPR